MMRQLWLAGLGLLLLGTPAGAQTLAERQLTAREDAKLADALGAANTHCGTALEASIAWPGFLAHKDKLPFATGDCEAALTAIYQMCNDPTAKVAIAQKLKALDCVIADGKQTLALDPDGTLTMGIDLDGANYNPFVQKFLGDHL